MAKKQYFLSVWHDDEYTPDFASPEAQALVEQVSVFNQVLIDANALIAAGGLEPGSQAIVFTPGGQQSQGLYAGPGKQMGGFWIVSADSAAQAKDWAERAAAACGSIVELRPLQGDDE